MKNRKIRLGVTFLSLVCIILLFFQIDVHASDLKNSEEIAEVVNIEDIIDEIEVTAPTSRATSGDYRSWTQDDSRWGSIKLGSSSSTMKSSGCLVTSITKLAIQSELKSASKFTPASMAVWLNNNGGFTEGGALYWGKPAELVSGFTYCGNLKEYGTYTSSNYNSKFISWINEGYHMVVQVKSGGHWVAIDEEKTLETGKVYIMDSIPYNTNADITLASRYTTFNRVVAYKGGTTPEVLPKVPTLEVNHNTENGSAATLKLSWTKTKDYTSGYWIERTEDEDGEWKVVKEITDGDSLEWLDKTVEPETKYYYRIQAFNENKEAGPYSNIVEFTTQHVHTYKRTVSKKATTEAAGKLKDTCTSCGYIKYVTISKISNVKLSYKTYTYNGKVRKPKVTVLNKSGKEIDPSYYTVTYADGRKNVGKYTVTVKFNGRYKGTVKTYFKILPKKTTIKGLTLGTRTFKLKWDKVDSQISGYEIKWSTSSNFSYNYKSKFVSKKYVSSKVTVARSNTKYFVKIRTYKTVDGVKYYSGWSAKKSFVSK